MSKPPPFKLVPYAGADPQRLRIPRSAPPKRSLMKEIVKRQKQGWLLSEIGDAFGSREIVRAAVLTWLSAP